jgi:hypothetical protein
MVEITPKGKYSIGAAILGFFSFLLPWVAFTLSNGTAYAVSGESLATLLSDLVTAPPFTPTTDSAILAWQQMAQAAWGWWTLGSIIFLVGCFVTLAQSFESFRWGGFWMLFGVLVSGVGIRGFSAQFTTDAGYTATVGPSFGIGLAVIATIVALVPAVKVDEEDRWVRSPKTHEWIVGTDSSGAYTLYPDRASTPRSQVATASAAQPSTTGPPAVPSPSASNPAVARRFCPECGAWYFAGENACPRDGASLKPVPEPVPR